MTVEMSNTIMSLKIKFFLNMSTTISQLWLLAAINASTYFMCFMNNFYLLKDLLSGLFLD